MFVQASFVRGQITCIVQIQEKIRYSKWKAADIAKALKEGRQPQPGPPGDKDAAFSNASPPALSFSPSHQGLSSLGSNPSSPGAPTVNLPPTSQYPVEPFDARLEHGAGQSSFVTPKRTSVNPGLWSNTATPGGEIIDDESPTKRPSLSDKRPKYSQDEESWSNAADVGSRQNSYQKTLDASTPSAEMFSSPLGTAFEPPPLKARAS